MRYLSSGESHGEQITVILEGNPSNLAINLDFINHELRRRQQGYGRGGRMQIESDCVKITGGVMFGKTTGAPLTLVIQNRDYQNHQHIMDSFTALPQYQAVTVPRPGHADLVGAMKYHHRDMKPVFERASARETVSRVVVGAICKQLLKALEIEVKSYVTNIGGIEVGEDELDFAYLPSSPVNMPCPKKSLAAMALIDQAKQEGNTLGGIVVVNAFNVPAGLGSFATAEAKLDAKIAASLLSIQACKGVEFGDGFALANHFGSEVHDEIIYDHEKGFLRSSNHYGGFEGGMTTGMPIVVKAVFKPIPTLMRPLNSIDINQKVSVPSHIERSDVCVVPSASVICEHTVAFELAKVLCETYTANSMEELIDSVRRYRQYLKEY